MSQQNEIMPNDKNQMNWTIITVSLVVIAISLFVMAVMQLSSGDNGTDNENTSGIQQIQNTPSFNPATITTMQISEMEFDFGTVKKGQTPTHTFKITNTGNMPLQFSKITADSGLVVVSQIQLTVQPQQTADFVFELNSKEMDGLQLKTVHINSNTNPQHNHLVLKANVVQ